jgi:acyl carrier protein
MQRCTRGSRCAEFPSGLSAGRRATGINRFPRFANRRRPPLSLQESESEMSQSAKIIVLILAAHFNVPPDQVTLETTFADLGADSLDLPDLCMELEEEFGIDISQEREGKLVKVRDMVELVEKAQS